MWFGVVVWCCNGSVCYRENLSAMDQVDKRDSTVVLFTRSIGEIIKKKYTELKGSIKFSNLEDEKAKLAKSLF